MSRKQAKRASFYAWQKRLRALVMVQACISEVHAKAYPGESLNIPERWAGRERLKMVDIGPEFHGNLGETVTIVLKEEVADICGMPPCTIAHPTCNSTSRAIAIGRQLGKTRLTTMARTGVDIERLEPGDYGVIKMTVEEFAHRFCGPLGRGIAAHLHEEGQHQTLQGMLTWTGENWSMLTEPVADQLLTSIEQGLRREADRHLRNVVSMNFFRTTEHHIIEANTAQPAADESGHTTKEDDHGNETETPAIREEGRTSAGPIEDGTSQGTQGPVQARGARPEDGQEGLLTGA